MLSKLLRGADNSKPHDRTSSHSINVAVLDDYQGAALTVADWSAVSARANITVYQDHLAGEDALADRLAPFDVVQRHAGANSDAGVAAPSPPEAETDRVDGPAEQRSRRRPPRSEALSSPIQDIRLLRPSS